MNRKEILEAAEKCICTDRNEQYGEPEDNFAVIAAMWDMYLLLKKDRPLSSIDVANMMVLFKMARNMTAQTPKDDSYIDAVGYMACAGELSARENKFKENKNET